jgi:hypothetical protein
MQPPTKETRNAQSQKRYEGTTKGCPGQVVQKGKKGNELGAFEGEQREEARAREMEGGREGRKRW